MVPVLLARKLVRETVASIKVKTKVTKHSEGLFVFFGIGNAQEPF